MADYEIVIRNETDTAKNSPIAGTATESKENDENTSASVPSGIKGILAAKNVVAPFVDQVVSHEISTVDLRTGASEQQERLSFAYSVGKQVGSAALKIATGAVIGGLPGAIVGLAVSVAHTAVSHGQKAADIQMQHDLEGTGMRFLNARAGGSVASFSGSRSRRQ